MAKKCIFMNLFNFYCAELQYGCVAPEKAYSALLQTLFRCSIITTPDSGKQLLRVFYFAYSDSYQ